MLGKGRKPLINLCKEIVWDCQAKKFELFFSLPLIDRFSLSEKWAEEHAKYFDYVRGVTLDSCRRMITDAIQESVPEKSKNRYFWAGFGVGIFVTLFLVITKIYPEIIECIQ